MVTQPPLILASASPRRTQLLDQIGIQHEVRPADVVEEAPYPMAPAEYVAYLSDKKARAVAQTDEIILAADTVVSIDGLILEKPLNRLAAKQMLLQLSGRTHHVLTGVTIVMNDHVETFTVTTEVRFAKLSQDWIMRYTETDEPYDKAGGYGIQAVGGLFVEAIAGDYYNVVGLPIHPIAKRLEAFGIKPEFA
ncbi:Maf family protein [Exiguobacterium oxidotolerans]|uniref:Maf family protein n=1 Tax=Exiguobacterium oxidotolerans TaxID=223958 RepID=UPI000493D198|nr:Maf family protein [Exiguobacterium oxidotolerans]